MTYRPPVADIAFVMEHVACWREGLAPLSEGLPPHDIRTVLDEAGRFAAELVAPLNRPSDVAPTTWTDGTVRTPAAWRGVYQAWAEAGWNSVALPADFGGSGLPVILGTATMEMLTSACMALATLPVLTQGAVDALEDHASETLKQLYLPRLVAGEWTATMSLTEPQAGSDLGALRTRAEPVGDGSYRIFGQKIFITFGEHDLADNIVHLVLARLPDAPEGTKGISLFLVPKFLVGADGSLGGRNDVRCTGIEHKLGIRSSPTCSMVFGDNEGAVGWLVGEPHRGLACMFTMMNKARLATGMQGVAIAERAFQQALDYAQERNQGRRPGNGKPVPIIEHPDVRRNLLTMRALIDSARAIAYSAAAEIDRTVHSPDPDVRAIARLRADLLTPVVKAYASDIGVEVASLGVQVHGGVGYIEETGAAQHLRDARIAPIYEGTNGIQAIDLVTRKLGRDGGHHLRTLMAEMDEIVGALRDVTDARLGATADRLQECTAAWRRATDWMLSPDREADEALSVATPYLRLFGTALGGALLGRGVLAALELSAKGDRDPAHAGRIEVARFFAEAVTPMAEGLARVVVGSAAAERRSRVALRVSD